MSTLQPVSVALSLTPIGMLPTEARKLHNGMAMTLKSQLWLKTLQEETNPQTIRAWPSRGSNTEGSVGTIPFTMPDFQGKWECSD